MLIREPATLERTDFVVGALQLIGSGYIGPEISPREVECLGRITGTVLVIPKSGLV